MIRPPVAVREYGELRLLQGRGIGGRACPLASERLEQLEAEAQEPSPELDRLLLQTSQQLNDTAALLCLRCRVSHPLEAWLRATHSRFQGSYGLDLSAMASYALDDDGRLTLAVGPGQKRPFTYAELASIPDGVTTPFTGEVLRSFDPSQCRLTHWARLKVQAHNGLKAYFRDHGLLLISDWALLRHTSARQTREACERFLRSTTAISTLLELHRRYLPLYDDALRQHRARTGKGSGWQPDSSFLEALAPASNPFESREQLLAIARSIRLLRSGLWQQSLEAQSEHTNEPVDPRSLQPAEADPWTPQELQTLIDAALQRAMDQHIPAVLAASSKDQNLLRCLWAGWAEGLSNRPLAERCGTSCGTVSKKLRPSEHATAIATAAALELKRHPAFCSCGASVEAAERLVAALRNHLLESEREGEVAPLRRWVQHALSQP